MSEEGPIKPDPEKKPKRPRDTNQLAKRVVDIATGQKGEDKPKDSKAITRGKKGGEARAKNLSERKRQEIAKRAAQARWNQEEE